MQVTCFLDESATDGSTPTAVVGGLLLNSSGHGRLVVDWQEMLNQFELWPGLHMAEFALDKRLGKRTRAQKLAICERAAILIDECRIYSMECCMPNADYNGVFSAETKKYHSQHQLCFIMACLSNGRMAEHNNFDGPISFVMDKGNPKAVHLRRGFAEMKRIPRTPGLTTNLHDLDFKDDEEEFALQAADVVCWGARRRASGSTFRPEHEPIRALLAKEGAHHVTLLERNGMEALQAHWASLPLSTK